MSEFRADRRICVLLILLSFLLLSSGCAHLGMGLAGREELVELDAQPEGVEQEWQRVEEGLDYLFLKAEGARPPVHLLRIDLSSPELSIVVPPPFEEGAVPEQLLNTDFASGAPLGAGRMGRERQTARVAALWNGTPFRYRFEAGRWIMDPVGVWVSGGTHYSSQERDWGMMQRTSGGRIEVLRARALPASAADIEWAVGGYLPIVREGENIGIHGERHARTAVGISRDGGRFFLCVVEGEGLFRPGLTSRETAELLLRAGAWDAINLDGGDSSFFLLRTGSGEVARYRGARELLPCFMGVVRRGVE